MRGASSSFFDGQGAEARRKDTRFAQPPASLDGYGRPATPARSTSHSTLPHARSASSAGPGSLLVSIFSPSLYRNLSITPPCRVGAQLRGGGSGRLTHTGLPPFGLGGPKVTIKQPRIVFQDQHISGKWKLRALFPALSVV